MLRFTLTMTLITSLCIFGLAAGFQSMVENSFSDLGREQMLTANELSLFYPQSTQRTRSGTD